MHQNPTAFGRRRLAIGDCGAGFIEMSQPGTHGEALPEAWNSLVSR